MKDIFSNICDICDTTKNVKEYEINDHKRHLCENCMNELKQANKEVL